MWSIASSSNEIRYRVTSCSFLDGLLRPHLTLPRIRSAKTSLPLHANSRALDRVVRPRQRPRRVTSGRLSPRSARRDDPPAAETPEVSPELTLPRQACSL